MANLHDFMADHLRKFIGFGLILIALLAALGLASQANNSVPMWSARYSLSPGSLIGINDLEIVRVSLGSSSPKYFSSKATLTGTYLTKNISQGELIPVSAITKKNSYSPLSEVPLGISKSELPNNLHIGDVVDLYAIPMKNSSSSTNLIIDGVRVVAIDSQSQNMGGVVDLLVAVDAHNVLDITDAIQVGRILVVRHAI